MEKDRGFKIVAVVALVIGVIGLSIGFAAFSKTLVIDSASVTTTERANVFETAIAYSTRTGETAAVIADTVSNVTDINAGVASNATWSGISFKIDSNASSASVAFRAYIANDSDYDAYLKAISSSGQYITCTASAGTTDALVQGVCQDMTVTVTVSGATADGSDTITYNKAANVDYTTGTPVQIKLASGASRSVIVRFDYSTSSVLPDGDFTVTIPAISLDYTSNVIGG